MKYKYYLTGDDVYESNSIDGIIIITKKVGINSFIKALGENGNGKKSSIGKNKEYIILGTKHKIQWTLNRITE